LAPSAQAHHWIVGIASDAGIPGVSLPGSKSTWSSGFNVTIADVTPAQITSFFCPGEACNPNTTLRVDSVGGSFAATTVQEPGTVSVIAIGVALVTMSEVRKRTTKA
jgi:hypothetical protein